MKETLERQTYTTAEAAVVIGVSAKTVRKWIRIRMLKAIPNTRPYLVARHTLTAFLKGERQ